MAVCLMFVCRLIRDFIEIDDPEKCFMGKLCLCSQSTHGRSVQCTEGQFPGPWYFHLHLCLEERTITSFLGIFVTVDITFAHPFVFWYLKFYCCCSVTESCLTPL